MNNLEKCCPTCGGITTSCRDSLCECHQTKAHSILLILERIKKAEAMGWMAVLGEFPIIAVWKDGSVTTICKENDRTYNFSKTALEKYCKITGYLYAGELAGNEPIPEGQKFRVKETGEIIKYGIDYDDLGDSLKFGCELKYQKSEIEPFYE